MIEALIALVLAGLCIMGIQYSPTTKWIYSMGLLALPLIYVAFALYGDSGTVAMKELMWGLPWVLIGILVAANFFQWSGYVLAAGWALHGSYDLNHELFFMNNGVPDWYPVLCGVFDFVIASYLVYISSFMSKNS